MTTMTTVKSEEGIQLCAAPSCFRQLAPGQGKVTHVGDRLLRTCYSLGCLAHVDRLEKNHREAS